MVRLSDLKTAFKTIHTDQEALPESAIEIPPRKTRNIYRIRTYQRGATLNELWLFPRMGATVGSTLDIIPQPVAGGIQDYPGCALTQDSLPLYKLKFGDATVLAVQADVASVDVLIQYADEWL